MSLSAEVEKWDDLKIKLVKINLDVLWTSSRLWYTLHRVEPKIFESKDK